jgi:DNA-binding XRE family transcriptional regulator
MTLTEQVRRALRAARRRRELSQATVAEAIGVGRDTLNSWEAGRSGPRTDAARDRWWLAVGSPAVVIDARQQEEHPDG